jgi:hypothetical protein
MISSDIYCWSNSSCVKYQASSIVLDSLLIFSMSSVNFPTKRKTILVQHFKSNYCGGGRSAYVYTNSTRSSVKIQCVRKLLALKFSNNFALFGAVTDRCKMYRGAHNHRWHIAYAETSSRAFSVLKRALKRPWLRLWNSRALESSRSTRCAGGTGRSRRTIITVVIIVVVTVIIIITTPLSSFRVSQSGTNFNTRVLRNTVRRSRTDGARAS